MIFSALWTILVVGGLFHLLRGRGPLPALLGMVLCVIVLSGDLVTVLANPSRRNVADFTLGAALATLFLAFLVWVAFVRIRRTARSDGDDR